MLEEKTNSALGGVEMTVSESLAAAYMLVRMYRQSPWHGCSGGESDSIENDQYLARFGPKNALFLGFYNLATKRPLGKYWESRQGDSGTESLNELIALVDANWSAAEVRGLLPDIASFLNPLKSVITFPGGAKFDSVFKSRVGDCSGGWSWVAAMRALGRPTKYDEPEDSNSGAPSLVPPGVKKKEEKITLEKMLPICRDLLKTTNGKKILEATEKYIESMSDAHSHPEKTKVTDQGDPKPPNPRPGPKKGLAMETKIYLNLDKFDSCTRWDDKNWLQKGITSASRAMGTKGAIMASSKALDLAKKEASHVARFFKYLKLGPGKMSLMSWGAKTAAATGIGMTAMWLARSEEEGNEAAAVAAGSVLGWLNPLTALVLIGGGVVYGEALSGEAAAVKCVMSDIIFGAMVGAGTVLMPAALEEIARAAPGFFKRVDSARVQNRRYKLTDEDAKLIGVNNADVVRRVDIAIAEQMDEIAKDLEDLDSFGPWIYRTQHDRTGHAATRVSELQAEVDNSEKIVKKLEVQYRSVRGDTSLAATGEDIKQQTAFDEWYDELNALADSRERLKSALSQAEKMGPSAEEILAAAIRDDKIYLEIDITERTMIWKVADVISNQKLGPPVRAARDSMNGNDYNNLAAILNNKMKKNGILDSSGVLNFQHGLVADAAVRTRNLIHSVSSTSDGEAIKALRKVIGKIVKETMESSNGKEFLINIDEYLKARKKFDQLWPEAALAETPGNIYQSLKKQFEKHLNDGSIPDELKADFVSGLGNKANLIRQQALPLNGQEYDIIASGPEGRRKIFEAFEECYEADKLVHANLLEIEVVYRSNGRQLKQWLQVAGEGPNLSREAKQRVKEAIEGFPQTFQEAVTREFAKKLGYAVGRGDNSVRRSAEMTPKVKKVLFDLFDPNNRPMAAAALSVKLGAYLASPIALKFLNDSFSQDIDDSSRLDLKFKKGWESAPESDKLKLVKASWASVYDRLLFALESMKKDRNVNQKSKFFTKNLIDMVGEVKEEKSIWPMVLPLLTLDLNQRAIAELTRLRLNQENAHLVWAQDPDSPWPHLLSLILMKPIINSKNFWNTNIGIKDKKNEELPSEAEEFFKEGSYFSQLTQILTRNKSNILGAAVSEGPEKTRENKRKLKTMQKNEIYNLIKEAFSDNTYGQYPYSHNVGEEDQPSEDYQEEWDRFSLDMLEDRSREKAIEFAKILIKEFELLTFVLDAVGKDQSLGSEILRNMEEVEIKRIKSA